MSGSGKSGNNNGRGVSLQVEDQIALKKKERLVAQHKNFFNQLETSFTDIVYHKDEGVPTKEFLEACRALVLLLELLGSTAFAPVRMDLMGNVSKLSNKYSTNPSAHRTVQMMIKTEIDSKTTTAKNSATDALMWLKRGLHFFELFLKEFISDTKPEVADCAYEAYRNTLRVFHNWMVQKLFAVAVKASPYRKDFLTSLGLGHAKTTPNFEEDLMVEIGIYVEALTKLLTVLDNYYDRHNLDIKKAVE